MYLGIVHLGLTKYFTDEIDGWLYLVDMAWFISFDDQGSTDHMSGSRDVEE